MGGGGGGEGGKGEREEGTERQRELHTGGAWFEGRLWQATGRGGVGRISTHRSQCEEAAPSRDPGKGCGGGGDARRDLVLLMVDTGRER